MGWCWKRWRVNRTICCVRSTSQKTKKAWLGQPFLIERLEKKFGEQIWRVEVARCQVQQNVRPIDGTEKSKTVLLYLMKYSRPNIAKSTWELSNIIDGANQTVFLEIHLVITYLVNIRSMELKLESKVREKEPGNIVCFSDSDYAGDPVTWRSVSGFVMYVLGVPVSWQAQRSMTLSNSKAKWVILLEAMKEIMLVVKLL